MTIRLDAIDIAHATGLAAARKSLSRRIPAPACDMAVTRDVLTRRDLGFSKPIAELRADRARWAALGPQYVG